MIIQNYFLHNGFKAYIKTNMKGEVTALCPYIDPRSITPYPFGYSKDKERKGYGEQASGQWTDSIDILEKGFYWLDYRGRKFNQDEIFYIGSALYNTTNILEQEDVYKRILRKLLILLPYSSKLSEAFAEVI